MKLRRLGFSPQTKATTNSFDKRLLVVISGLLIFGILMVFNASVVDATRQFGDGFFYARRQLVSAALGVVAMLVFAQIPYKTWAKYSHYIFAIAVGLLVLVLIPKLGGVSALGARRWVDLGPISLQPAEFAKFALCVYFAKHFSENRTLKPFLIALGTIVVLVMLEPDLGTTGIILAISGLIYFASGAPISHFLSLVPIAIVGLILVLTSPYRRERLFTFFDPTSDPLGSSYHIRQILIALGSGGLWGVGLGQSRQKYLFLPEPATDSIFAIIGEELGFVGASVVILAFVFLIWRGYSIAARVEDPFGRLLALGITSWIGVQAFVNLAAMVALVPLTGVPLPFVSYGGSALVVNLAAIGILLNISKNRN
jgi:cell division protein FtsW